jgi:hypothetical protein
MLPRRSCQARLPQRSRPTRRLSGLPDPTSTNLYFHLIHFDNSIEVSLPLTHAEQHQSSIPSDPCRGVPCSTSWLGAEHSSQLMHSPIEELTTRTNLPDRWLKKVSDGLGLACSAQIHYPSIPHCISSSGKVAMESPASLRPQKMGSI